VSRKAFFLGDLNKNEIDELVLKSGDIIDKETDAVYIFPLCEDDFKKVRVLSYFPQSIFLVQASYLQLRGIKQLHLQSVLYRLF
jgi:hypothetical protein